MIFDTRRRSLYILPTIGHCDIRAEDEDGDDGADLWELVYNEDGGFRYEYRRFVDGYKSVWEYDGDKQGRPPPGTSNKGTYKWVGRKPTAEEEAHWDPVLGEDGKVVRNRWRYEGKAREREAWRVEGKLVHGE